VNFSSLAVKFTAAADLVIQLLLMFGMKSQSISSKNFAAKSLE